MATICRDAVQQWNGRVLVLAHVKELLQQSVDKLRQVCSDLPVGVYSAGLKRRDTEHAVMVAGIQSVYKRAGERPSSAAGGAEEPMTRKKPSCPAGLLQRLVRRDDTLRDTPAGLASRIDVYFGAGPDKGARTYGWLDASGSPPKP